ncbi:MAG: 30S ribosomal protein S3 [Minisyncoccales bacterium]
MAHKVHPKGFRIKDSSGWYSRGYYEKKFPAMLEEDFLIRQFLHKRLAGIGISEVEIDRFPGKMNVIISCVRPGLIIGRQGQGIEELRKKLEKLIFKGPKTGKTKKNGADLRVEIREITNPWASAAYIGQSIAAQIEKRMPYLKVLKQSIEKAMGSRDVQGVRVQVAGRLNGVEIARTAWLGKGRLPRQTIRADIDYELTEAHCTYGVIGIKVWIYKGEKI